MQDDQKKKLKLKVSAIKEGTVIDHIPAKNLFPRTLHQAEEGD